MKLIDKEKVITEIKRRISLFKKEKKIEKWSAGASQMNVVSLGARIAMLEEIKVFLDTLEVKEVDLDEELDFIKDAYYYFTSDERSSMKKVARHFFELGLKAKVEYYD